MERKSVGITPVRSIMCCIAQAIGIKDEYASVVRTTSRTTAHLSQKPLYTSQNTVPLRSVYTAYFLEVRWHILLPYE